MHCVKSAQIRSFFLARIFSHLGWIGRITEKLSTSSTNAGKYGSEKTPYLDFFHGVMDSITTDFLRLFQK